MARMIVTYFDIEDQEMQVTVDADDESAALGWVLDEYGESIARASPFAVWREHQPRKGMGRKGRRAKGLGKPVLREDDDVLSLDQLDEEDVVGPSPIVAQLLDDVQSSLGVKIRRS